MARNVVPVTLAVNGTTTTIVQGGGLTPVGIYVPANLTGTSLTFNAYNVAGNIVGLVGDGAGGAYTKTLTSAKDQYIPLSADLFGNGIDGLQIISGSSQSTTPAVFRIVFK